VTTDTHTPAATIPPETDVTFVRRLSLAGILVGGIAFLVCAGIQASLSKDTWLQDALMAYLAGFVFWAAVPIGALCLTMLHYITGASWGLVLRRIHHAYLNTWPVIAALFIPIAIAVLIGGKTSPFWWTEKPETLAGNNIPAFKEVKLKQDDYLNPRDFLIRSVAYLIVFFLYAGWVTRTARRAEELGDEAAKVRIRYISGPGIPFWFLLMTFIATDWVMSVEPTWASTMFPVVFGVNAIILALASGAFLLYSLVGQNQELMTTFVKDKFRIDMGTLLFGFTMIWAYASFSQFMLIWAGNLPEEITYYLRRKSEGWEVLTWSLVVVHWFIPFVVFLFREVKTDPRRMRVMTVLILCICAVDVVWWLVPALPMHHDGSVAWLMAFAAVAAVGGVFGLGVAAQLKGRGILPEADAQFLKNWGHH
jgi:hypothetical protein